MAAQTRLIYTFDDFQLEPDVRKLTRCGEVIQLHGKAFEMLMVLISNRGRLLTKDELFQMVWPDQIVEESNLTVNMSAIRRALGERASSPRYITTVSGHGYRFTGDVRQINDGGFTIERESFARVSVEEEETESGTALIPSATQIASAVRRLTSHPLVLLMTCVAVLAISGVGIWVKGHRASAAPVGWSNVVFRSFATHGGIPYRVAISPDGKTLVYDQSIKGKHSLWLGQVDSNSSVEIMDGPDVLYHGLAFSPDGQTLYVSELDSAKLFRLPVIGGVPTQLLQNVDSAVSFSPDGKQFAFLRHGDGGSAIVIADAPDGKNERILIKRGQADNFSSLGLSWSPDGESIAVAAKKAGGQVELLAVSVPSGAVNKIGEKNWNDVGNVKWQSDGAGVLLTLRDSPLSRKSEIWFAPYPKGEPRKVTNDTNQYITQNLSISGNGVIAVIEGKAESEVWLAPDGDISRSRRLLQGVVPKYEGVDGLTSAPDGHVLYTAYVGDAQTIWDMDGDGGNRRQLTNNVSEFVDRLMKVTADNRYIVFQSNRSGEMQIWRADRDGSNLRQLTHEGTSDVPSLSPDSKWIVYTSNQGNGPRLWRMSIDGEERTQLTNEESRNSQISADGMHIAYLSYSAATPPHLSIISFARGELEKTFALPDRPGPNLAKRMCWTPDGKAILYKDSMEAGIWRQRLDEQHPQLMKEFAGVNISQLSWTLNGKNLVYTRYVSMQEILLLQNSKTQQ